MSFFDDAIVDFEGRARAGMMAEDVDFCKKELEKILKLAAEHICKNGFPPSYGAKDGVVKFQEEIKTVVSELKDGEGEKLFSNVIVWIQKEYTQLYYRIYISGVLPKHGEAVKVSIDINEHSVHFR